MIPRRFTCSDGKYVEVERILLVESGNTVTAVLNPAWESAPFVEVPAYADPGTGRRRFHNRVERETGKRHSWRFIDGKNWLMPINP